MSRASSSLIRPLLTALLVLHTSLAGLAGAAQQAPSQGTPAPRVQSVRTFGGSTRFVAPVRTVEALRRSMSRPAIRQDIARVLQGAGMSGLEGEMVRILTEGQVMQTTLPSGTAIEWMALRRRGRPGIIRNARWDGRPAPGYQFVIDNLTETYTFFVPEVCGNISLIAREPSREAARRAEEARVAAENARRAEDARAAEARKAEEARAAEAAAEAARTAEEARRAEEARKAEEARQAEAARQAEEARKAEEARQAEIARLEAEAREARFRPFVNGLFGKQHRQYDDTDPAKFGRLVNPVIAFGDAIIGAKGGVALRLTDRWALWPAIGVAGNLERRQRSSLFGDLEMAYRFPAGAYLGSGLTMWDMTHPEIFTIGWLGTGGVRLWRNAAGNNDLDLSAEWRQFFDRGSDPDVNYQFWAGVRFVFR